MDEATLNSRLSRISTVWRLLNDAQASAQSRVQSAQAALIERYQGAAYRYLLGAVRDPDVADDLFQEFAVRCLQGGFRRADPHRGRFRDYLKTMLYHLIVDHQKRRNRGPHQLDTVAVQPEAAVWDPCQSDRQFVESWRDELLARAWAALAEAQRGGGPPYHSVLKFRAENPKIPSTDMAARLTEQLHPAAPFTETAVRKMLQRARAQFARILIDDVGRSLGDPAPEDLEQELVEVGLLSYCRSQLANRHSPS
jgi:RNA polymerase sigma factor (sigma-70 family)